MYYSASAVLCTPNAPSQGGHYSLGAQAGAVKLRSRPQNARQRVSHASRETTWLARRG
jgi:hypothetical protein